LLEIQKMKIDLDTLLEKYHRGDCTIAELDALRQYFLLEDTDELHAFLIKEWEEAKQNKQAADQELKAEIWKSIRRNVFEPSGATVVKLDENKSRKKWMKGIAIAASLVGLFAIGMWMWQPRLQKSTLVEKINTSEDIMKIDLSDGSVVWLNRNSEIRYGKNFNDSIRAVSLTGEAFFKVAKNPNKPFIVQTDNVQTKVLGTSFNVQAFQNRETIEVALLEGKVDVGIITDSIITNSETLEPGDLFAYHKIDKTHTTERFDDNAPYAWRDGIIYFYRADVHEVAQTLQNWYDVTITIEQDSSIQGTLVHKFDANELTLEQALRGISLVSNYRFEPIGKDAYRIVPKQ